MLRIYEIMFKTKFSQYFRCPQWCLIFLIMSYKGVIFHETEESCKIWKKTNLWFGKWLDKWRILTCALYNLKNLQFNGLPLTKVYNFWAKKVWRSYLSWHWSHVKFEEKLSTPKFQNQDLDGILLLKVENVWA